MATGAAILWGMPAELLDADACYQALVARDGRFDGLFFVGVVTTGIYCRPVCRARTPGRERAQFFRSAAEAEAAGFRACFRCRPELAPGRAPVDAVSHLVSAAVRTLEEGGTSARERRDGDGGRLDGLARSLGVSARHLRRAMQRELGVAPRVLVASRRLALARQLVMDTRMPLTDVAFASGFGSVRRFNASMRACYRRSPTELRRTAQRPARGPGRTDAVELTLTYRQPYDWAAMLAHFRTRAIAGVEQADADAYRRTVRLGPLSGWLEVTTAATANALRATISLSLSANFAVVVGRLRRQLDLDADPRSISTHLARDPRLAPLLAARPGLRLPGSFEPFEVAARAIIGQQISVAAARTIAGRLAARLGTPISTPFGPVGLDRLFPDPAVVASAPLDLLRSIGLPGRRAEALRTFAAAVASGEVSLAFDAQPERLVERLAAMPGLGPWTAEYIAMRALGWPDAFPEGDLGLRRALGGVSARTAAVAAARWRPWRAYAATHLWTDLAARSALKQRGG